MIISISYIPVDHNTGHYTLALVRSRHGIIVASAGYVYSSLAGHLAETLRTLVANYGKPERLITDGGEAFNSDRFRAAVKRLGVDE